ncbi:hypothetical protein Egran_02807 [Elaphomyces granulatus]|uniref:SP-RING-type domain-containing protein n=1 Tax=Elaphomyces granulatus TaxID=519963 RepID=A0A232LZ39_9EURO|nr:hypothetical protein Egran_02807 [Elaphomyces granulatus]
MPEATASRGHHRHRDQERATRNPTLPEYQPLSAPLNPGGQRALAALQANSFRRLRTHLQNAAEKLTETAGEVIERATDARVRYERQQQKRTQNKDDGDEADRDEDRNDNEDNSNDEEFKKLVQLEERVKEITDTLEEKMRGVIDAEVKLAVLEKTIGLLGREAEIEANASQVRGANNANGEEGDGSDEAKQEGGEQARPVQPLTDKLAKKLAKDRAKWETLSLTQRYSTNNTYVGFYRMVHDAKHPGDDIPPLPHASTWFSHLETPTTDEAGESSSRRPKHRNRGASPADSDDIAIARERISLKCPITLLPFKDPVTSTKCPHSFERQAIEDMIRKSPDSMSVPGHPQRIRCARCPVCSVRLTADDLRRDANLLRRVRRAQASQAQEPEDENDDEDNDSAEEELESEDDGDHDMAEDEVEIEEEGSPSVVPNTQYSVKEDIMEE